MNYSIIDAINSRSKNQEIMEFGGFGPSHNKIEILLDRNGSEYSPGAFKPII